MYEWNFEECEYDPEASHYTMEAYVASAFLGSEAMGRYISIASFEEVYFSTVSALLWKQASKRFHAFSLYQFVTLIYFLHVTCHLDWFNIARWD